MSVWAFIFISAQVLWEFKKKKLYKAKSLPTNEQFEITNTKIELSNTGNVEKLHECLEGQELNLLKTVKVELIKKKMATDLYLTGNPGFGPTGKCQKFQGRRLEYYHLTFI